MTACIVLNFSCLFFFLCGVFPSLSLVICVFSVCVPVSLSHCLSDSPTLMVRLPDKHSWMNFHPCVLKFSLSVSLSLSLSFFLSPLPPNPFFVVVVLPAVCAHWWLVCVVQKLEHCYQHLAQAYASILDVMKSGKRLLGKYFRVAFFGQVRLFGQLGFTSVHFTSFRIKLIWFSSFQSRIGGGY